MKKYVFLLLTITLVFVTCSKFKSNEKDVLKDQLTSSIASIVSSSLNASDFKDLSTTNCDNPYENAGLIVNRVTKKILNKLEKKDSNQDSIVSELSHALEKELPNDLSRNDTISFDSLEYLVENTLSDIYVNEGYENYIIKSKKIENIVKNSNYFNDIQKKRILIHSSVMRQEIGLFTEYSIASKEIESRWANCMKAKLLELQNCQNCFLEKIQCALFWVECFAVKGLDCLISIIF